MTLQEMGEIIDQAKDEVLRLRAENEELLSALMALDALIDFGDEEGGGVWMFDDATEMFAAMRKASAAIAKARGLA